MVGRFIFLFLARATFREISTEMDVKTVNVNKRALHSKTRTTTRKAFNFKFSRLLKEDTSEIFFVLFFTTKVSTLISLKEVKSSPDR